MTVTITMTLSEQLTALARLNSLAPNYRRESMVRFDPSMTAGNMRELLPMLRSVGIEPTDAAQYDKLSGIAYPEPVPPLGRRLDSTPAEHQQRIKELALYQSVSRDAASHSYAEQEIMRRELLDSMRAEADSYLDALRPAFDAAITMFVDASALGITVDTTSNDVLWMSTEAQEAYKYITGPTGSARALDGLAGLRIRLSGALGIEPVNWYGGGDALTFGICFGAGVSFDEYSGARRWLSIAAGGNARLVGLSEMDRV